MTKTVYVCKKCGTFYTEHYPADNGTAPCDDCGADLTLVKQTENGIINLNDLTRALRED